MENVKNSKFFISYSHLDREIAYKLKQIFEGWNLKCFIDKDIEYKEDFFKRIKNELTENITHLIVIVSQKSNHSIWAGFEIGLASNTDIQIVPVLIDSCPIPPFLHPFNKWLSISNNNIDKVALIDLLIQLNLFEDGFVTKSLMMDYPKRFPNEVFAEEVLKNPIHLRRDKKKLTIQINRNDVEYVLISNKGKQLFCNEFISTDNYSAAKEFDIELHNFQLGKSDNDNIKIPIDKYPLRWISGGTLSIVKLEEKEYIPLFFRDIVPVGWNVSLGGSERDFLQGDKDKLNESLEDELNKPIHVIMREFLEETLILNNSPENSKTLKRMWFYWDSTVDITKQRMKADKFSNRHTNLREKEDGINILNDENSDQEKFFSGIETDFANTNSKLEIRNGNLLSQERNILIAVNILELGIEVVKVIKYSIANTHYYLDGEILKNRNGDEELVRMPFALISLDYLRKKITEIDKDISSIYTDGAQSSFEIQDESIDKNEVILFDWDIKQRIRLSKGNYKSLEIERHKEWCKNFGERYFYDEDYNIVKDKLPLIFTPSTVKLLCYYFANK